MLAVAILNVIVAVVGAICLGAVYVWALVALGAPWWVWLLAALGVVFPLLTNALSAALKSEVK